MHSFFIFTRSSFVSSVLLHTLRTLPLTRKYKCDMQSDEILPSLKRDPRNCQVNKTWSALLSTECCLLIFYTFYRWKKPHDIDELFSNFPYVYNQNDAIAIQMWISIVIGFSNLWPPVLLGKKNIHFTVKISKRSRKLTFFCCWLNMNVFLFTISNNCYVEVIKKMAYPNNSKISESGI